MLSGVSRTPGGAQASAPDKKALEARRQEILKDAQGQGGTQARAVRTGQRQAETNQTATAPTRSAQGRGPSTGQTGGTARQTTAQAGATSTAQASDTSKQGQATQNSGQARRGGWEASQNTKPYSGGVKRWDAKEETTKKTEAGKGTKVDVVG